MLFEPAHSYFDWDQSDWLKGVTVLSELVWLTYTDLIGQWYRDIDRCIEVTKQFTDWEWKGTLDKSSLVMMSSEQANKVVP